VYLRGAGGAKHHERFRKARRVNGEELLALRDEQGETEEAGAERIILEQE
jgi:hypothetical protein